MYHGPFGRKSLWEHGNEKYPSKRGDTPVSASPGTKGNLDVLAEVADGEFAQAARQWVGPFRAALCGNSASTADGNGRSSRGQ
jgi:hypothetical protein